MCGLAWNMTAEQLVQGTEDIASVVDRDECALTRSPSATPGWRACVGESLAPPDQQALRVDDLLAFQALGVKRLELVVVNQDQNRVGLPDGVLGVTQFHSTESVERRREFGDVRLDDQELGVGQFVS